MFKLLAPVSTVIAVAASPGIAATVSYFDLAYSDQSSRNQLDLYIPEGSTNAPVVMHIHGGAWLLGDKADPIGLDAFLDAGIAVASMNYRLSSDFPTPVTTNAWPAQLEDLGNAFSFLRDNGLSYGYDSSRIASFGASAGGHLAAWAGLALADDPETRLVSTVTWFPPTDLYNMDADDDADEAALDLIAHSDAGSPESLLIGGAVSDNKALADAASPAVFAANLDADVVLPSFLMMHGTQDPLVSSLQSLRLFDAINAQGGSPRTELFFLEGAGHGGPEFDARIPYVVGFLKDEFEVAAVPLPASLPLLLAGFSLLFGLRRFGIA